MTLQALFEYRDLGPALLVMLVCAGCGALLGSGLERNRRRK